MIFDQEVRKALKQIYEETKQKTEKPDQILRYGTAGFRYPAKQLPRIMVAVSLISALYSVYKHEEFVGVMITASHNPLIDNGVKLVDPEGEMMEKAWEEHATYLSNASNGEVFLSRLDEILQKTSLQFLNSSNSKHPRILLGKDTRPSCDELMAVTIKVYECIGLKENDNYKSLGLTSTPQVHFLVNHANEKKISTPGMVNLESYYEHFSHATKSAIKLLGTNKKRNVLIDCANGVGFVSYSKMMELLSEFFEFTAINIPTKENMELLNDGCGAEFVQKKRNFPRSFSTEKAGDYVSLATIDGDCDRLVYFGCKTPSTFVLIDGDKMSTLLSMFIEKILKSIGLEGKLIISVVQTAYANGASTKILKKVLGPQNVHCVATGVKYLHGKAKEADIGIYFEANGHGTIVFSKNAMSLLSAKKDESKEGAFAYHVLNMVNQTVGDALQDFLVCEVALMYLGMTWQQWSDLYTDLPSVMSAVKVKDRFAVLTTPDETRVTAPAGFQDELNKIVEKFGGPEDARSFVRPSGTEDIVRVYAEAKTQEEANALAKEICTLCEKLLN